MYLMDLNHTLSPKLVTPVLPKLAEIKTYVYTTKKWKKIKLTKMDIAHFGFDATIWPKVSTNPLITKLTFSLTR